MVYYSRVSSLFVTTIFVEDCWQHWRNMQTSWQLQLFHNLFSHSRGQLSQGSTWPKGSLDACTRVSVCVFGAVKMLPVSISHFVCSCSFNGFIFPAKLEKLSGFSLPLRVGHSTRCHPAHSQLGRLCATSAASWLLLIMCPTHTQGHTLGAEQGAQCILH